MIITAHPNQQTFQMAMMRLERAAGENRAAIRRALFRCGAIAKRVAVQYCPISPTQSMLDASIKSGKTKPKNNKGRIRAYPGGLRSSIAFASDDQQAEIFVASNAPGGRYANRIHDEKGVSWWNRGPGTEAAGPQADHKFILRAIQDNEASFTMIMNDEADKVKP